MEDQLQLPVLPDLVAPDPGKLADILAIPMENCRPSSFLGLTVAWTAVSIGTRLGNALLVGDHVTIAAKLAILS